ncbi:hypothetical protein A2U01_0116029 [Trifolium medium]|uniref:Uncharacterized protein n=1 Tax=Trifolium medium TaxID=97028 RepID=A0A392W6D8_9FABA|nr:hypothetical protein [Trifolium medium]
MLQEDGFVSKTGERVVFEAHVLSRSEKIVEGTRGCVCYVCVLKDGREVGV